MLYLFGGRKAESLEDKLRLTHLALGFVETFHTIMPPKEIWLYSSVWQT